MLIPLLLIVFALLFGVYVYRERVVPHALPAPKKDEEEHFVDQIFDYRTATSQEALQTIPVRMEEDDSIECYGSACSVCPRCGAWDVMRRYNHNLKPRLPPFTFEGWKGFWFPMWLRSGPSLLKDACTQGPLRREEKVTLQRCHTCGAVWRVRLVIRPMREGRERS